jgi:hypothetical protein
MLFMKLDINILWNRIRPAVVSAAKVAACLILAAAAVIGSNTLSPALAASITLNPSVQASFPSTMTFKVTAQSDSNITQLRLHYIVNKQNVAKVISEGWAQFTPATSVTTQWVWDMRKSSLPPGAQVEYWWTALDNSGKTGATSHQTTTFDDTRHTWQSTTSGQVTILWYNGNQSFANSLMTAAQDGLQRIQNNVGAFPQGQVKIYIYASSQDLQAAQLFAPQWEGGATFEGYNLIAIGVPTNQLDFGERAVPHELTHWVVGQITFNNYGAGLPTWLSEGLATYGESTTLNPQYQSALNNAIQNNQLLSVRTLSSPFSAVASVAYTSYGESNSIVTFMVNQYGKDKMIQLLKVFGQGTGYDDALKQVYGFDQDGLDAVWRKSLGIKPAAFLPEFMLELVPVG